MNILNKSPQKIYAKYCKVKSISTKIKNNFYNTYRI